MQARKLFVILFLAPLCLFVAGYCWTAASAGGGWHQPRDDEPYYIRPSHYSAEFYEGLRWAVMIAGVIMAIIARKSNKRGASVLYWAVAALFNPLVPIHLDKKLWQLIDALAGWIFLGAPTVAWPENERRESQTLKTIPVSEKNEEKVHNNNNQHIAEEKSRWENQHSYNRFVAVAILLCAVILGFGIYKGMVAAPITPQEVNHAVRMLEEKDQHFAELNHRLNTSGSSYARALLGGGKSNEPKVREHPEINLLMEAVSAAEKQGNKKAYQKLGRHLIDLINLEFKITAPEIRDHRKNEIMNRAYQSGYLQK